MTFHALALGRLVPGLICAWALAPTTFAVVRDTPAPVVVQDKSAKKPKPTITLRSAPTVGFAPARFVLTAEIVGGADDYEDFYCATVEWDWGDDTRSETKQDCEPYEAGKSTIKRRFVMDRVFNVAGDFRVEFRLKQKNKVVGVGRTEVKVRCGVNDSGDCR
jgi:hypothetical protein